MDRPKELKKYLPFLIIIALVAFFRFFWLTKVPPSPSLDEVSIGWNAYSILRTGGDEYGNKFPLLLRAYDDWRPALYVYLVIPFVKLLGLNVLSVRLPSVILSALTVMATYFLCLEIFKKEKFKKQVAFWTSLILAISPWHIYLSRLGHEVNPQVAFTVFGLFFFFKFLNQNKKAFLIFLSAIFFALSFYTYQSQKVFGPLLLLSLGLIYFKELKAKWQTVLLATIFGALLIVPIAVASLSPQALLRFEGTSIFSQNSGLLQESANQLIIDRQNNDYLMMVLHNRRVIMFNKFAEAYISHCWPSWLFFNSGMESHKVPNLGLFYLWELPLMILGLVFLFKLKSLKKVRWFLLSLIFLAPLSASITTDFPHAMRVFNAVPGPMFLTALGIVDLSLSKFWRLLKWGIAVVIVSSCFLLCANYFIVFPQSQSSSFQYSLNSAINYVLENEENYEKVAFSNQEALFQSYMFFLFFSHYDPVKYQALGGTVSGGFAQSHQIGKLFFVSPKELGEFSLQNDNVLLIGNYSRFKDKNGKIFSSLGGEKEIITFEK